MDDNGLYSVPRPPSAARRLFCRVAKEQAENSVVDRSTLAQRANNDNNNDQTSQQPSHHHSRSRKWSPPHRHHHIIVPLVLHHSCRSLNSQLSISSIRSREWLRLQLPPATCRQQQQLAAVTATVLSMSSFLGTIFHNVVHPPSHVSPTTATTTTTTWTQQVFVFESGDLSYWLVLRYIGA